jgi:hypothetical protein
MADKRITQPVKIVDPTNTNEAAVVTLADALANPAFSLSAAAGLMFYNGATWDRARGSIAGGLLVDTELPAAAALADNFANPTAPAVGAFLMLWDGAAWDRASGPGGVLAVDTELPTAAALADATANPTVPGVGAFMMGYNGATWDRVRVANTGRLQVDVVSGGGETLPTGATIQTVAAVNLAAGASGNADGGELGAAGSTYYLAQVDISSSVAFKGDISTVVNGTATRIATVFGQAGVPLSWRPPNRRYVSIATTAGADNWRVVLTNMDTSQTADFYVTFWYQSN